MSMESRTLGQYITQEYELLERVLSNLNRKDLRSAAQVCRAWQGAVKAVSKQRLKPFTLLWNPYNKSVEEASQEILLSRNSEPDICILFMNFAECYRGECQSESCTRCSMVLQAVRSQLLRRCILVCIRLPRLSFAVCGRVPMVQGFSAAFLPQVPGVHISVFSCRSSSYSKFLGKNCLSSEELDAIPGLPPTSLPLRCLLLFHNFGVQNPGLIIKSLEARHGNFAVGGGLCKDASRTISGFAPSDWCIFGIALSGQCVQASSVIFEEKLHQEQHIHLKESFIKVKKCMGSMKNSIAFWFPTKQYDSEVVNPTFYNDNEYSIFKQHFPTTPLSGGLLIRKVGRTHLPGLPNDLKDECLAYREASEFIFISFIT